MEQKKPRKKPRQKREAPASPCLVFLYVYQNVYNWMLNEMMVYAFHTAGWLDASSSKTKPIIHAATWTQTVVDVQHTEMLLFWMC